MIESKGALANTFRVESTGCAGVSGLTSCEGQPKTTVAVHKIVATFQVTGFLDFIYFTNFETEDPASTTRRTAAKATTTNTGTRKTSTANQSNSRPETASKARCTPTTQHVSKARPRSGAKNTTPRMRSKSTATPTRPKECPKTGWPNVLHDDEMLHRQRPDADATGKRHQPRLLRRIRKPIRRSDSLGAQRLGEHDPGGTLQRKRRRIQRNDQLAEKRSPLREEQRSRLLVFVRSGKRRHQRGEEARKAAASLRGRHLQQIVDDRRRKRPNHQRQPSIRPASKANSAANRPARPSSA